MEGKGQGTGVWFGMYISAYGGFNLSLVCLVGVAVQKHVVIGIYPFCVWCLERYLGIYQYMTLDTLGVHAWLWDRIWM
jgi:hypothetical protein